jgi:hypothetical protein
MLIQCDITVIERRFPPPWTGGHDIYDAVGVTVGTSAVFAAMRQFKFSPDPNRPFLDTLFLGAVVVVTAAFGAAVLYYATSGVWLLVHAWPH